jgi:hypothetical protein
LNVSVFKAGALSGMAIGGLLASVVLAACLPGKAPTKCKSQLTEGQLIALAKGYAEGDVYTRQAARLRQGQSLMPSFENSACCSVRTSDNPKNVVVGLTTRGLARDIEIDVEMSPCGNLVNIRSA